MNDSLNTSSSSTAPDWKGISDRVKAVLTDPKNVWPSIKAENKSIKEIYLSYLIPLALIGALCGIVGNIIFGGMGGLVTGIVTALVGLVITLGLMFVNAYIYKFLAPNFGGSTDETSAFKLVAYSATASLVGAFLTIIPPLAIVGILFSIYSLYTVYQGIPVMTGVTDKRVPYFVVCFVVTIVVNFVIGGILLAALGVGAMSTGALVG